MIRDRKQCLRLFGFDYRIEIFVPAQKRQYGYYVFPLLEGDRFVGRIDMEHDSGTLSVSNLWLEHGVQLGEGASPRSNQNWTVTEGSSMPIASHSIARFLNLLCLSRDRHRGVSRSSVRDVDTPGNSDIRFGHHVVQNRLSPIARAGWPITRLWRPTDISSSGWVAPSSYDISNAFRMKVN